MSVWLIVTTQVQTSLVFFQIALPIHTESACLLNLGSKFSFCFDYCLNFTLHFFVCNKITCIWTILLAFQRFSVSTFSLMFLFTIWRFNSHFDISSHNLTLRLAFWHFNFHFGHFNSRLWLHDMRLDIIFFVPYSRLFRPFLSTT